MDFLLEPPFVVRVLTSLFIILLVNKFTRQLFLSVVAGTLTIALWTGQNLSSLFTISWGSFSAANNLFLMVIILQVIWLSSQMSQTGVMKRLVDYISARVSQRGAMAILPAVIGLLPMPGGAIFSAPLVDDLDHDKSIDPVLKAKINYWFRHVWEYWWPLYPGVLLAVDITGLPITTLMLLNLPLSFASIFSGYFFLLRKIKPDKTSRPQDEKRAPAVRFEFLRLIAPIVIIIASYGIIKTWAPSVSALNKYLPMIIGILLSQLYLQILHPLNLKSWVGILRSKKTLSLTLLVAFIRIYGAFVEAQLPDGSLLMEHVRLELSSWGIPVIAIIMLIPFISGLTTGIAIGFVGASFPIVMSIIGNSPDMSTLLATSVLAYACGYMGMILSPVHVCLIVTSKHFKTSISDSLVRLLKPSSVIIVVALIMYFLLL